jgi:hypothetical protein
MRLSDGRQLARRIVSMQLLRRHDLLRNHLDHGRHQRLIGGIPLGTPLTYMSTAGGGPHSIRLVAGLTIFAHVGGFAAE